MKRVLLHGFFLFLCVFTLALVGCTEKQTGETVPSTVATVQALDTSAPEPTVTYPLEEVEKFSFIIPGETTILEVLETIPGIPEWIVNNFLYWPIIYTLSDGTEVHVIVNSETRIVVRVDLKLTDGSFITINE